MVHDDLVAATVHLAAPFDGDDERVDHAGMELLPGVLPQLVERGLLRERLAVRTRRGHRVERVGDRDDVRLDRLTAVVGDGRELRRFARRARRDRGEEVDAGEDLDRDVLVHAHLRELLGGELAPLVQEVVRHDELADVVHQRGEAQPLQPGRRHAQLVADVLRVVGDPFGVSRRCTGPWPRARR